MQEINLTPGEAPEDDLTVRSQFIGELKGNNVQIENGGAALIQSSGDVTVTNGGALALTAAKNMNITNGGGQWLVSGGDMTITSGGGGVLISRYSRVEKGFFGLLIARQAEFGEGSRVLLNTPQAIAMGAALGAAFALLSVGLRRRR